MAELKYTTVQSIEGLFDMQTGYVMDFSNSTFQRFIKGTIGVDVYQDKGYEDYFSKANKLRQVMEDESIVKVNKLINELLEYYEDLQLKNDKFTDYDKKKIREIRESLDKSVKEADGQLFVSESLDEVIKSISTRQAYFMEMSLDEKLKEIGNLIEFLLKQNGKYIALNYDSITLGLIQEDDIKKLRKKVQCFRHSTQESLNERNNYSNPQKQFIIEFGITICNLIYKELKK